MDYCLGRFLGELRSRGLYDDTVVIFTSDHGEHLGDHGLWGKITLLAGVRGCAAGRAFPGVGSLRGPAARSTRRCCPLTSVPRCWIWRG
ncbi:MAG: sulfatase-like hydrolase/transferase [Caldilineaceae bacterium]|nr:sulfatase-like hydrolase/transferase [Caldilineaceae bacterium]